MLSGLFPRQIDNVYRGNPLAIWLLLPVLLFKTTISVNIMGLNPWIDNRELITKIDGIPLDSFSQAAQEITVFMFASWGLGQFMLCLLTFAALIRYRGMLAFAIVLLAVEQLARKGLSAAYLASAVVGSEGLRPSALINLGFSIALFLSVVLAIFPYRKKGAD